MLFWNTFYLLIYHLFLLVVLNLFEHLSSKCKTGFQTLGSISEKDKCLSNKYRGACLCQKKRINDYQELFLHNHEFRLCGFLVINNFVLNKKGEDIWFNTTNCLNTSCKQRIYKAAQSSLSMTNRETGSMFVVTVLIFDLWCLAPRLTRNTWSVNICAINWFND